MSNEAHRVFDALLIVQYQSGDDCALTELIRRYEARVRANVARWIGATAAVDDVCQEVWIAVIQGLPKLKQSMAWQSWLGSIIRSQVALFFRQEDRRIVPLDAICDREAAIPPEPLVEWEKLTTAVKNLGVPYESMLRMYFWESLSYQQIAETLQIPIGTVRSRLHWARSQLAKQLNNEVQLA